MKKPSPQTAVIIGDIALLPVLFLCKQISNFLLKRTSSACIWTALGGKCITCGGTHFIRDILSGNFAAAFRDNEFLFLLTVYFALSWLLCNLYWLFRCSLAKQLLARMYNRPTLILFCITAFAYVIIRNIPMWIRIGEHFISLSF